MKIVTVEEMRRLEEVCDSQAGISTDKLMENAGLAVAQRTRELVGDLAGAPVLVLVGPGNNGGDGLVAARHLQSWGARVTAYLVAERRGPDPKLTLAEERGVIVERAWEDTLYERLSQHLGGARAVIDAVLGTGRARPLEDTLRDVLLKATEARQRRHDLLLIALDLPTGLDADTGQVDPVTPAADVTLALGHPKPGHLRFPGAERVGRLETLQIGIPDALASDIPWEMLTPAWVAARLPKRPLDAHKGSFGRLLVVAGSLNYVGAAVLAAGGAYRAGAGLVTIATPESVYPIVAGRALEATHLPLPEASPGQVSADAADMVREQATEYEALVVGCGMGQADETRAFLERLLLAGSLGRPIVVDADGLNNLAQLERWDQRLTTPAVLTPHPGEMARLTNLSATDIQSKRWETAQEWAQRWGQVVVLKGAFTVVASPSDGLAVSPFANPALASAGTGDVLAGAIGGLLAQGLPTFDAACCGVYLHAAAGERVRAQVGDSGLLASDLLPWIAQVARELRAGIAVSNPDVSR